MCVYTDILATGAALQVQMITAVAIILSIALWVGIYRWQKVGLLRYALPIALWVVFGTLDIIITTKGTFGAPMREGNPLARAVFLIVGDFGPIVASVLWISLWAGIVLVLNKIIKDQKAASFLSLAVFYSLATGHLFGFSSWFIPLCAVSKASWLIMPGWLIRLPGIIAMGCLLSGLHMAIAGLGTKDSKQL
jgi:hypothetical protein